jgi:FlaA1/EpsC-like NDP-sugar epimerase
MVTGAGGSIGSELCRLILRIRPKVLLLVERAEYPLYAIDMELREQFGNHGVPIYPLLADVRDEARLREIMTAWSVNTIYHAAAYKHVPMVEHNPMEGIVNNVFGTWAAARVARDCGVERFTLISTDKAVCPTSVMGATKRLCELILQSMAAEPNGKTIFTMVRFGNVLGSSGSVVPRFRKQIQDGGPVTVTHQDITRYFMTIPEASQLVVQAASLGTGGDVFLLDMGEPVRIIELARKMVKLSGLTVKDAEHPNGDIEIQVTGLRPGEKLYEELLVAENPSPTKHPRIFYAKEVAKPREDLLAMLESLRRALAKRDRLEVREILLSCVPEYTPKDGVMDWVALQEGEI